MVRELAPIALAELRVSIPVVPLIVRFLLMAVPHETCAAPRLIATFAVEESLIKVEIS